ncbi:MAG: GAF domain-containing sensor histidine kinase, partial [Planctomycetota bacterium]
DGETLDLRMSYNISEESPDSQPAVSRTIVDDVAERGVPVLIENALSHPVLREQTSVRTQGIRSVMCVPITLREEVLGVIYVDNLSEGGQFDSTDLEMLTLLSSYAGAALYAARLADDADAGDQEGPADATSARLAHDFKNVLSAIQMRLSVLEMEHGDDPETVHTISRARRAVKAGRNLVREASAEYSSEFKPVDLRELLTECAELQIGGENEGTDHKLQLQAPDEAPVMGNRVALRELFNNLLSNAAEAMPDGGRVTVRIREDGDAWTVEVHDEGPGVTEDARDRIFEPFFSTRSGSGTGLGLNIACRIARRHGGDIHLDDEEGEGACFMVELPRAGSKDPDGATD